MCKPYININTVNRRFFSSCSSPQKNVSVCRISFLRRFFFGDSLVKAINLTATVILHLTCRRKENGKKKTNCRIANSLPRRFCEIIRDHEGKFTSDLFSLFTRSFSLAVYKKNLWSSPEKKKKQRRRMKRKDISLSLDIQRAENHAKRDTEIFSRVPGSSQFFYFQIVGISCHGKMCFWRPREKEERHKKKKLKDFKLKIWVMIAKCID